MLKETLKEIRYLQQVLDERADEVSSQMKIARPLARRRIRQAWAEGCILCKQPGPKEIHFYKNRLYVICSNCYMENILERGEKKLHETIVRRLSHTPKNHSHRH